MFTRNFFFEIKPKTRRGGYSSHDWSYRMKLREIIKEKKSHKIDKKGLNYLSNFSVRIIFFFKNNHEKIDLDNLAKPVLDELTGIFWKDDSQVTKLFLEKRNNEIIEGISITISNKIK